MRFLTDLQIIGLATVVGWAVWFFGRTLLDDVLDPWRDRFEDVDELAERDR